MLILGFHLGEMYISYLKENDIDVSCVKILDSGCTGQAYILSNVNKGDNSIIIVGGANQAYTSLDPTWKQTIQNSDILLLQMEIPQKINLEAAKLAKEAGKIVVIDLGGAD